MATRKSNAKPPEKSGTARPSFGGPTKLGARPNPPLCVGVAPQEWPPRNAVYVDVTVNINVNVNIEDEDEGEGEPEGEEETEDQV
jgi:hypothetical protein